MIKIKISNVKDFKNSEIPQEFGVMLKNSKEVLKGKLVIDMPVNLVQLEMPRALSKDEKLLFLKEFFYNFCITDYRFNQSEVEGEIEHYYFVEYNNVKSRKTIMQNLMEYELGKFNGTKKKEKILFEVLRAYKQIQNRSRHTDKNFELEQITNSVRSEIKTIIRLLNALLEKEGYKGSVVDVSYRYNSPYEMGLPYVYGTGFYNLFTLEYFVCSH